MTQRQEHCIVQSATYHYILIQSQKGCTFFCMPLDIPQASGALRQIYQSGQLKDGSGTRLRWHYVLRYYFYICVCACINHRVLLPQEAQRSLLKDCPDFFALFLQNSMYIVHTITSWRTCIRLYRTLKQVTKLSKLACII